MSKYDEWTNIELADAMTDSLEAFEGHDADEIASTWDRSDMIQELVNEHGNEDEDEDEDED